MCVCVWSFARARAVCCAAFFFLGFAFFLSGSVSCCGLLRAIELEALQIMGKKKKGGEAAAKPLDPGLIEAVQCIKSDSTTCEAKVHALLALGGSSCGNDCVRMDLVNQGVLEPLLHLLRTGLPKEKEMAAYALRHLSGGNFLQTAYDNPSAIVSVGGANLLISLLSGETEGQKEHAAAALCNLATKRRRRGHINGHTAVRLPQFLSVGIQL